MPMVQANGENDHVSQWGPLLVNPNGEEHSDRNSVFSAFPHPSVFWTVRSVLCVCIISANPSRHLSDLFCVPFWHPDVFTPVAPCPALAMLVDFSSPFPALEVVGASHFLWLTASATPPRVLMLKYPNRNVCQFSAHLGHSVRELAPQRWQRNMFAFEGVFLVTWQFRGSISWGNLPLALQPFLFFF